MDKTFLEELENSEYLRVKEKVQEADKEGKLHPESFFRSKVVARTLEKGNQAVLSGFDKHMLPNVVPFSERVLLEICPSCECVRTPELIKPYLERQLVIPIFGASYILYPRNFVEFMLGYPHLSAQEFYGFRSLALQHTGIKTMPSDGVTACFKECRSLAKVFSPDDKLKEWAEDVVESQVFTNLEPFLYPEYELLPMLSTALREKDEDKLDRIRKLSHIIREFRSAQVLSFVPQVQIEDLRTLELFKHRPNMQVDYDVVDIRDSITKGLRLSYDPTFPLETYLDVVSDRRYKIRNIVYDLIEKAGPENETFLSNLQREIERINQEIETLKSSKRRIVMDLATNFVLQNKSIVAGFIIGGGMGIAGLGLIGCGTGIISGLFAEAVSKKAKVSMPKEARELAQRLSTILEPRYEKLLSNTLSADIRTVQLWRLRKRIVK